MTRQWGMLCPDGHGILYEHEEWTQRGVAWCPNEEHSAPGGTAGRFYRKQEVVEGWFDPEKPRNKTEAQLAMEARVAEREEERRALWMAKTAAAKKPKEPKAKVVAAGKTPKECGCGCGGMTKGGRFLPGHDAKFHSAQNKAKAPVEPEAAAEDLTVGAEAETPPAIAAN